jgi:phospholipid-translocating ATPase/phospholipid-transporting ATPase
LQIPLITNTYGIPTVMMPLSFVIVVDAIFAALEDLARHKADDQANASTTLKYDDRAGSFETTTWSDINVGDVIKVLNREVIPADVVILAVKEKTEIAEGRAYVETKSLDGETNLKMRRALKTTLNDIKTDSDIAKVREGGDKATREATSEATGEGWSEATAAYHQPQIINNLLNLASLLAP